MATQQRPVRGTPRQAPHDNKKHKKQRRRRKNLRLVLLCLLLALAGAVYAFFGLKITHYTVHGESPYDAETIWTSTGLRMQDSLLRASLDEAEEALMQSLPYITNATITRTMYPQGVRITVVQEENVLTACAGEQWFFMSPGGKVLELLEGDPKKGFVVKLPDAAKASPGHLLVFSDDTTENSARYETMQLLMDAATTGELAGSITQIDLRNPSNVSMRYRNRITLKIGTPTELDSRLAWAKHVLTQVEQDYPNQTGTLDLTDAENTPFRPEKEETTTTQPTTTPPVTTTQADEATTKAEE